MKAGTQFEGKCLTNMSGSASPSTPEDSDSSGDEFVPNSQSGSETEEEEYYAAKSNEIQKNVEDLTHSEDNNASLVASKSACTSVRKRTNEHLCQPMPKGKRCKMGRNTSHASKINCCDASVVKKCLCESQACCDKDCLERLSKYGEDAIAIVSDLRYRRFAGTFTAM